MSDTAAQMKIVQRDFIDQLPVSVENCTNELPSWDATRHLLTFHGQLVKHFKSPAHNQELILSTLQEVGWPTHVDDPLPPSPDLDAKRRLNDAIRCLNKNQVNVLLHFRCDGTGQGILWEVCQNPQT